MTATHPIARNASTFAIHRLQQQHPGILKLLPSGRMWIVSAVSMLVGVGVIGFALTVKQGPWIDGFTLALGGVFAVIGLVLPFVSETYEFNRDTGLFRRCRFVFAQSRPLSDIVALQVIDGGKHQVPMQDGHTMMMQSYELNVVFSGDDPQRINLTNHSDLAATRAMASRLAEFLEISTQDGLQNPQQQATDKQTPANFFTV